MEIAMLSDRVLVREDKKQEKSKGGLFIPDNAKERPLRGDVMCVGPGRVTDSGETLLCTVKAGDKVLYGKYSGTEVELDGREFMIIRETDIFAVLRGDEDG